MNAAKVILFCTFLLFFFGMHGFAQIVEDVEEAGGNEDVTECLVIRHTPCWWMMNELIEDADLDVDDPDHFVYSSCLFEPCNQVLTPIWHWPFFEFRWKCPLESPPMEIVFNKPWDMIPTLEKAQFHHSEDPVYGHTLYEKVGEVKVCGEQSVCGCRFVKDAQAMYCLPMGFDGITLDVFAPDPDGEECLGAIWL